MQIKMESDVSRSKALITVIGVYKDEAIDKVLSQVFGAKADALDGVSLGQAATIEGFQGKVGQVFTFPTGGALPSARIFLFGLGAPSDLSKPGYSGYRKMAATIAKRLAGIRKSRHADDEKSKGQDQSQSKSQAKTLAQTKTLANIDKVKGTAHPPLSACFYLRKPLAAVVAKKKNEAGARVKQTAPEVSPGVLPEVLPEILPEILLEVLIESFVLASFSFEKYKGMKKVGKQASLDTLTGLSDIELYFANCNKASVDKAVKKATAVGAAVNMARTLIAEPPAFMTPSHLAQEARRIAREHGLTVKIMDEEQIAKLGMGSFLGVARGAKEPPRFIVLKYNAPKSKKTVALVGKGVTFDSGGLSLKTAGGMEHMKYDMSGAAIVLGAMQVIGQLKPAVSVLCVVPATENMPGSNALHPGDVLIAMNGKTIEVNNTDAEGRLILADALTYAVKEGADELIDIATLTGAVVSALGRVAAGLMANDQALADKVIQAGVACGEQYWQLPLFEEYKDALKSDVADLKNAGSRGEAGSSCAAMFLQEFVEGKPWVHLDIAGVAWTERERDEINKGGTAFVSAPYAITCSVIS